MNTKIITWNEEWGFEADELAEAGGGWGQLTVGAGDEADGAPGAGRGHGDADGPAGAGELLGQEGHPETGGHESLDRREVRALERHGRADPGRNRR